MSLFSKIITINTLLYLSTKSTLEARDNNIDALYSNILIDLDILNININIFNI